MIMVPDKESSTESTSVIVTGGAGFIGSHIVEYLVNRGYRVTVYDNFDNGDKRNLEDVLSEIDIVEGDILDQEQLTNAIEGHDVVSHQAAQLKITTAVETPQQDLAVNTRGSLNVFDAAVETGVSEVVYASSACVYGQAESIPQSESHPTEPNWPYGVSKLAVEKYANIYANAYDVPFTGLRYGITYGPKEWYGRVMTVFLKRALDGKPPVVWGGHQQRDFVHVTDAARLHAAVVGATTSGSTVYNVGTGVATSIDDLAHTVLDVVELDAEVVYEDIDPGEDSKKVERDRLPQELEQMVLNPQKAKLELDWEPKIDLQTGLKRQYEWIQNNAERWENPSY